MTTAETPKVLMIAYACNPEGTGEHWLGWGWAEQAAKKHRVYLLTTTNARDAIGRHAKIHGIQPVFVPVPDGLRKFTDLFGRFGGWMRKMIWAYKAARVADEWHRQEKFALVHQTTFHTFRVPFLATRLGIPSVWGPVAGGEHIPFGFYHFIGPLFLPESIRRVFNRLWFIWPAVQRALEQVDVIFVSNRTTMRFLGSKVAAKCVVVPPNAMRVEDEQKPVLPHTRTDKVFRLLYVGNCLPTRAMGLVFAALARAKLENSELTIIGTGLGLELWRREAREYGVAAQVKFLGLLPHAQLAQHYDTADLLVFPALRDSGGSALLEAMSKGLPVICLDWAGPAEMVDADSGVKIPVTTPEETIQVFADALVRLQKDSSLRARLGLRAAERARSQFTWAVKRELLENTYQRLLSAR
ncbi:MAG: glycosyltransferase [Verrucomicrobia bacterium]|jgi:glycosyltransferase involved in cell wall biosynthesis|nr:glycosyltransferase [Verrucomicrobiota bacterium]